MEFFNHARLEGGGALAIGTAQGALDKAIDHVKKRKAFGGTLAGFRSYGKDRRDGHPR